MGLVYEAVWFCSVRPVNLFICNNVFFPVTLTTTLQTLRWLKGVFFEGIFLSDQQSLDSLTHTFLQPIPLSTQMDCSVLEAVEGNTEYIYCCGAVTEVLKVGTSIKQHQGSSQKTPPELLFLIIPGNPGVVGFYKTFMQTLHQKFGRRYPVWAVSHAGHCVPPDTMDMIEDPPETSVNDVFGLNGQIEHKLAFLREHVPRDTKLVLIGHSIGCYIILDMMKRDPELQVVKSVLLFPTIERMAQTPQGKVMTPVLCHLRYFTYLPIFLLSLLPETLKAAIVKLVFSGLRSLDHTVIPATVSLISVDCAANAMYMGGQEMRKVLARDNFTINQNLNKLVFYYGATDHWCPVQYYQDMKREFPHGDIKLCENGIRHAFVLDAGKEVASLIFEWIQSDVQTSCKMFST